MGLAGLLGGKRHERAAFALYGQAVQAARDPYLYERLGVPDTLDGRFDMVGLYAILVIRRLRALPAPGAALAQAVFDAMFSDMDLNLREMGVGDLSVGKRVRAMWEALHGRAAAYQAALEADDPAALADALARNVWRGGEAPQDAAALLGRIARTQDARLAACTLDDLRAGRAGFLPAAEAAGR